MGAQPGRPGRESGLPRQTARPAAAVAGQRRPPGAAAGRPADWRHRVGPLAGASWPFLRGIPLFLLIAGVSFLARRLSGKILEPVCRGLGLLYYAIAFPWRRRWQQRVQEWGAAGNPAPILRTKFRQYMLNLGDIARMETVERSQFRLSGQKYLHAVAGRGAVLVSIHMGNWELAGAGLALYGVPVTVLAWPSRNPYIERMQLKRRGAYGTRTAYPGVAGVAKLLRTLDQGGHAGLMLDVNLPGEGLAVSFLGRTVYFSPLCLLLALRTGVTLLPMLTFRQRDGRCRIIILPPCRPGGRACLQQDLQRLAQVFERAVRRHPDQYHWLKQI